MRIYSLLFCILFALSTIAQQTATKETYFEKSSQGLLRFYFDKNYFLVDKNCPFKSIERLSDFIVSKNVFNGAFKDFDHNGKVVLTGSHEEGRKQGSFKAYHPNGALKWEMTFADNQPVDTANYFYPDGKPMLVLYYRDRAVYIISHWDQRGKQRVVDGNGSYAFKMPFDFYNEYGYPFYERRGRIKDGLPTGYWVTNFLDEKNRPVLYTEEQFNSSGQLTEGYNVFLDENYNVPIPITPAESFPTAEALTFKQCNFDDFSGFNNYLKETLDNAFLLIPEKPSKPAEFTYSIQLSKDGIPSKLMLIDKLEDEKLSRYLEAVIKEIPFYFPSLDSAGEAIADQLVVSGIIGLDSLGNYNFHSIQIKREQQP